MAVYVFPLHGVLRGRLRDLSCEDGPFLSIFIFLLRFGLFSMSSCVLLSSLVY